MAVVVGTKGSGEYESKIISIKNTVPPSQPTAKQPDIQQISFTKGTFSIKRSFGPAVMTSILEILNGNSIV
ncbi:hypothetical protein QR98_0079660 [Sarcoptes scabiei]|uniref:Uncharacterized protein n=1 Tax=Sarcoptes scabiei TaxID=52283 RepID=A0A132AEL2_SARSC|nr:hypothetical protein QR98_0079660 [Sarcoptes scabiei]